MFQDDLPSWQDVNCQTRIPLLGCQIGTPEIAGSSSVALNITSSAGDRRRPITWPEVVVTEADLDAKMILDGSIYGATVHISHHQCLTGDLLDIDLTAIPAATTWTKRSGNGGCFLFLDPPGSTTVAIMKTIIDEVKFTYTDRTRPTISFAIVYWDAGTSVDLVLDIETRHVYQWVSTASVSADDAAGVCAALGKRWHIVRPTTFTENQLALLDIATHGRIPIGFRHIVGEWRWEGVTHVDRSFVDWAPGKPANSVTQECAEIDNALNGQWQDVDCTASRYTTVLCERTVHYTSYLVTHVRNDTEVDSPYVLPQIFATSQLYTAEPSRIVYGVTVHMQRSVSQCHHNDNYFFGVTFDSTSLLNYPATECDLEVVGRGVFLQYNMLLQGLSFKGPFPWRSQVQFTVVYWTIEYVRRMVHDAVSGKTFSTFAMHWYWTAPVSDPQDDLSAICQRYGLEPIEISSATEANAYAAAQHYGDVLLGAERPTPTTFRWRTSLFPLTYGRWHGDEPSSTTEGCVVQTSLQSWRDVDCTNMVNSIGCQATSWPYTGVSSVFAFSPPDTFRAEHMPLKHQAAVVADLSVELAHVKDDVTVYGATVQIAERHCNSSADDILWDSTTYPAYTATYRQDLCALWVTGAPTNAATWKTMLSTVQVNTSTNEHPQMAIAFILWTHSMQENMLLDIETRHAYSWKATLVAANITWADAYDYCRLIGNEWWPITLDIEHEARYASAFFHAAPTAIGAQMKLAATSYQWITGEPMHYIRWDAAEPAAYAGKECVEYAPWGWFPVSCTAARYYYALCETSSYDYYAVVSLMQSDDSTYPEFTVASPLPLGALPSSDPARIWYGVTVEVTPATCQSGDRFYLASGNDKFLIVLEEECIVMIAGAAPLEEYTRVINDMEWRGDPGIRTEVRFTYVFWESTFRRELTIDYPKLVVYNALPATAYHFSPGPYPYVDATTFCSYISASQAEAVTAAAHEALERSRRAPILLGKMQHSTPCSIAQWTSSGSIADKFAPWQSSINLCDNTPFGGSTDICPVIDTNGNWTRVACSGRIENVGCSFPAATTEHGTSRASFEIVYIRFGSDFGELRVATEALNSHKDDNDMELASMQLHPLLCSEHDTLTLNGALPAGFSFTYDSRRCLLLLRGSGKALQFKTLVNKIQFLARRRDRVTLTFYSTTTDNATFTEVFADPTEGAEYRVLNLNATVSHEEAASLCAEMGQWALPRMLSATSSDVLPRVRVAVDVHPTDAGEFVTGSDNARMPFNRWSSPPNLASGRNCTAQTATGSWELVDCSQPQFTILVCMRSSFSGEYFHQIIHPDDIKRNSNKSYIFNEHHFPDTTGTSLKMFGATVQTRRSECGQGDAFLPLVMPPAELTLINNQCELFVVGVASVRRFIDMLSNIEWRSMNVVNYDNVTISYVLWTNRQLRFSLYDVDQRQLTYAYHGMGTFTPRLELPSPSALCKSVHTSSVLAEPRDSITDSFVRDLALPSEYRTLLGLVRPNMTSPVLWRSDQATAAELRNYPFNPPLTTANVAVSPSMEIRVDDTQFDGFMCTIVNMTSPLVLNTTVLNISSSVVREEPITRFAAPDAFFKHALFDGNETTHIAPRTYMLYGFSVSLATEQCEPGDRFEFGSPPAAPMINSNCTLVFYSWQEAHRWMKLLPTVKFVQSRPTGMKQRSQLHFSYTIFEKPLGSPSFINPDTGRLYAWYKPAQRPNVLEGYDQCGRFGSSWKLATLNTWHEYTHAARFNPDHGDYPVPLKRASTNSFTQLYPAEVMAWSQWGAGQPDTTVATCVLHLNETGWDDRDCVTPVHSILCESDEPLGLFTGLISLLVRHVNLTSFAVADHLFPGLPPNTTNTTVYGATVQIERTKCSPLDRFYFDEGRDGIAITFQSSCLVYFAGAATQEDYNVVLDGLSWRSNNTIHSSAVGIRVGLIFWSEQHMRDNIIDLDGTGATMTYFRISSVPLAPSTMPALSSSSICPSLGLLMIEPRTQSVVDEMRRVPYYSGMDIPLGATRTDASSPFKWYSDSTAVSSPAFWAIAQPSSTDSAQTALVHNTWAGYPLLWYSRDYDTRMSAVLCTTTHAVTPAPAPVTAVPINTLPPPPVPTKTKSVTRSVSHSLIPPTTAVPVTTTDAPTQPPTPAPTHAPTTAEPPTPPPTRGPFQTPAPPAFASSTLRIDVNPGAELLKQGDVRQVLVTMTTTNGTVFQPMISINVSTGVVVGASSTCFQQFASAVRGNGFSLVCQSSDPIVVGAEFQVEFYLVTLPNVTLPQNNATIAAISFHTHDRLPGSNATFVFRTHRPSCVPQITSYIPGFNEISFRGVVVLRGFCLDAFPQWMFVGPYVVRVTGDANTVSVQLPSRRILPNVTCDDDAPSFDAVRSIHVPVLQGGTLQQRFAEAIFSREDHAALSSVWCTKPELPAGWHPQSFTLHTGVQVAANLTGLHFKLHDSRTNLPIDFMEPGSRRHVKIQIPDHGPVYAFANELRPQLGFDRGVTVGATFLNVSLARQRQIDSGTSGHISTNVHYFESDIAVDPFERGSIDGTMVVQVTRFLQTWRFETTVPLRLPGVLLERVNNRPGRRWELSLTLKPGNGTILVNPKIHVEAVAAPVAIQQARTSRNCQVNGLDYSVHCNRTTIALMSDGNSEQMLALADVVVPPFYLGDINFTATFEADNTNPVRTHFIVVPDLSQSTNAPHGPLAPLATTPEPGLAPLSAAGIFIVQPGGQLHFLVITMLTYFVWLALRTIYYIYRRRHNPDIGFEPFDLPIWKSLLPGHVLIGLFSPCHYRCANVHITQALCTVMSMYLIASMFHALNENVLPGWSFHIFVGFAAAAFQLAVRPILQYQFYLYVIHDPSEVEWSNDDSDYGGKKVDVLDSDDIDVLAPSHFDNIGLDMWGAEKGDDPELVIDEALQFDLERNADTSRKHDDYASRFAIEGMQWATPLDLDDDIVVINTANDDIDPDALLTNVESAVAGASDVDSIEASAGGVPGAKPKGTDNDDDDFDFDADFGDIAVEFDMETGEVIDNRPASVSTKPKEKKNSKVKKAPTAAEVFTDKDVDTDIARKNTLADIAKALGEAEPEVFDLAEDPHELDLEDINFDDAFGHAEQSMVFEESQEWKESSGGSGGYFTGTGSTLGNTKRSMAPNDPLGNLMSGTASSLNKSNNSSLGRSNTVARLHADYAVTNTSGSFATEVISTTDDASYTEDDDSSNCSDIILVTRHLDNHRRYGYATCAIYVVLCIIIVYTTTAGWSRAELSSFWRTMICAAVADFLVIEWCYLGLKYLYRWMTSDTAALLAELHPYEGEVVPRDW